MGRAWKPMKATKIRIQVEAEGRWVAEVLALDKKKIEELMNEEGSLGDLLRNMLDAVKKTVK